MEIRDNKYDELLTYIETGARGNLPEVMFEYVNLLELIRGMHMRYKDRQAIVKFLQQPPYELSYYQATQRYTEAINFFYLDHEIKRQAWKNLYAEQIDRAAELVLKTATNSKDLDIYKNMKLAAVDIRGLNDPEKMDVPKEFFQKKIKIYTLDPRMVGKVRPDRRLVAKHIDSLDIPEADKQRARSDAGLNETYDFIDTEESEIENED